MTHVSLVAELVHHMSIRGSMRFGWSDNLKPKYHHSRDTDSKCDIFLKREGKKKIKLLLFIAHTAGTV